MHRWTGSALVQIMGCRLGDAKPLSKPKRLRNGGHFFPVEDELTCTWDFDWLLIYLTCCYCFQHHRHGHSERYQRFWHVWRNIRYRCSKVFRSEIQHPSRATSGLLSAQHHPPDGRAGCFVRVHLLCPRWFGWKTFSGDHNFVVILGLSVDSFGKHTTGFPKPTLLG